MLELTPLQEELRRWLHTDNLRWGREYSRLSVEATVGLIEKYRSRAQAAQSEAERRARKQMEEADEREGGDAAPCSTLMHDTGGGRRVVRSTRNLGG